MKTQSLSAQTAAPKAKKKSAAKILAEKWPKFYEWKQDNRHSLAFPLPPNLANCRMHWRAKEAARQEYFKQCDALLRDYLLPMPPLDDLGMVPQKVRLRATLYTVRVNDWDNLTARIKWPVDWLVRNGYLADDKPANCQLEMPTQQLCGKEPPRVEFEVEEI